MPRKRPTEATWDSDDDLLNDEVGINATYATKRVADEFNPDEVDEEALLAYSDDEIQVVAEDEIEQTEEVVEEVYVEDDEEEVPHDGQVVQEEIYEESVPVTEVYHAEQTTHSEDVLESVQQPEHEDEESDSGSDGEGGRRRRARFQSERGSFETRSTSTVSLSTTTKKEIPDKLPDISAEDQAKIDKYMTKGGGRGRGRGQGRQAWGARGGQQQQFRPRIGHPIQTHHAPIQHHQYIQHVEHQHYDYGQNVHHVQPPQQPHAHYYEHPQHAPPQHAQHVPQQHAQHVPQQHAQHVPQQQAQHVPQQQAQHVPQQQAQHVPQQHAQPVHYEPPVQHVVSEPPRPQQPVVGAPASQPIQTKKIHINPHFKPKVESPRPAWEPPRSQPAPQYAPPSQPQPVPQHYPPRSEPVHQPVYSQAWTSAGPVQHYAQPQYTVSQAPPPQPYQPPPPVQPAYQPPPQPAYSQSAPAPAMPPQRYQAPPQHVHHQVVHQHPGPQPGQEGHRYPGPPPPQHHYQAPPPPRHEPPRLAPPTSQGVMYHPQHPQHVHVESSQPPVIHEQHQPRPQVTPVQARPQVAQVRPRQQVISRPAGRPPCQQYVQHGSQVQGSHTIQTVIGRKKPGYNQQQQQFSAPQQNQPRQPFQGTNRQSVQVTIPRKRLPDVPNPAVDVLIAPKLAKIDRELPQNNIKIQTVDMSSEPVDEEYQRKLEEQKRLREEMKRKKEARRLMQSSQRKEQVQKTLAEQGIQVVEPAPVSVNQTVQVIERRPVNNQKVNMRHQNQNVVTQVPIQENTGPKVVRTSGPTQTQKQPGPGLHLVSRKVYKLITLKDGRQIRQLVSSGQPEEVSGPPPQQDGVVRVVQNQNVNLQRRFPGPSGPQQRMPGPRPGPRPGFRPDFHGPRLFKQFQSQGPPGPGPRFRGPGPMGMRFRGPGPHMMRFSGPHRPPMGMHQGPRKMIRGPPPRQALPPTAKGAPKVQGQQTTPQAQGVRQDNTQVTGIKRTINTAASSKGAGDAATAPKRVVVDNSLVKKPIGDGVTKSVSIGNLSSSTSLVGIRKLCTSIGPLESIKLDAQHKKATAKFQNPTHAAQFVEKYNRHMVDLSTINLSLLV